jgi:hypothetical protein
MRQHTFKNNSSVVNNVHDSASSENWVQYLTPRLYPDYTQTIPSIHCEKQQHSQHKCNNSSGVFSNVHASRQQLFNGKQREQAGKQRKLSPNLNY